ncbi:vacuolar protein sorting-associated protein VTA1 homolog [Eurosta solidaginis]|uniref:vacuolar protein sorting-associated protein VTA1 homolog n=1 Tax=Eurosta solidaginis TaxID=178769 RepID=UPI0035310C5A
MFAEMFVSRIWRFKRRRAAKMCDRCLGTLFVLFRAMLCENHKLCSDEYSQIPYALNLFLYADKQDRASKFGKNVVKAYYSSGVLHHVQQTFGELSEESINHQNYAKWTAAYINNCLKNGETPMPGPLPEAEDEFGMDGGGNVAGALGGTEMNARLQDSGAADDEESGPTPIPDPSPSHIPPPTADEVLHNPRKLPGPPVDEEKPGGFEPYVPQAQPSHIYVPPTTVADLQLTPEQIMKEPKYTKGAIKNSSKNCKLYLSFFLIFSQ